MVSKLGPIHLDPLLFAGDSFRQDGFKQKKNLTNAIAEATSCKCQTAKLLNTFLVLFYFFVGLCLSISQFQPLTIKHTKLCCSVYVPLDATQCYYCPFIVAEREGGRVYLFLNNAVVMVLALIFDLSVLSQTEIGGTLPLASAWMFYIRSCSFCSASIGKLWIH